MENAAVLRRDTISLLDDALSFDFGFKGTYSKSDAEAQNGIAKTPPPASTQFATGTLVAKDYFLPEAGVRWKIAPGHELYASYAENMAMFQGGFKLGPQSVSQAVWDVQGKTLKPETSKSFDGGYRYVSGPLQVSLAGYYVKFDNRLLQYNPCPTNPAAESGLRQLLPQRRQRHEQGCGARGAVEAAAVAELVQFGLAQQDHL